VVVSQVVPLTGGKYNDVVGGVTGGVTGSDFEQLERMITKIKKQAES
jgi:hypothetical protein